MRYNTPLLAASVIAPLLAVPVPVLELRAPQAAAAPGSLLSLPSVSSEAATFAASATGTAFIVGASAVTQTGSGDPPPALTTALAAPTSVASDAPDADGDDSSSEDSTTFPHDPQVDILIGQLLNDPVVSQFIGQLFADAIIGETDDPTDSPVALGDATNTVNPEAHPVSAPVSSGAASVTGDQQLDMTLGKLLSYKAALDFLKGLIGDTQLAQTATVKSARPARPTGVGAPSSVPVVPRPVKAAVRRVFRRPIPRE